MPSYSRLRKVGCHAHACRGHVRKHGKTKHAHDKRGHGTHRLRPSKPSLLTLAVLLSVACGLATTATSAAEPVAQNPKNREIIREIYVPFEDLHVLLDAGPRRVLLARDEYEQLLKKAQKTPKTHAPRPVVLVSADYTVTLQRERARLVGTLTLDVLEDALHAVPLDLGGVGLRSAVLDGKSAAIGRAMGGRAKGGGGLTLFVRDKGRRRLELDMVAPLETTAARQMLHFRLPQASATRFRMTVPGDVEIKGGADVIAREFDEAAGLTRFELAPRRGDVSLVMSLNSRLERKERAVIARSVIVDEVTEAYERLHATISLAILHRAVDRFRFVVPEGFDVTDVRSPLLASWAIVEGPDVRADRRVLDVRLREPTTDTVVLNLSAVRTPAVLDDWKLPRLEPLDVVGQVAVVGLLVEDRLKAESIRSSGLIAIDTDVLKQALPETIFRARDGSVQLRPVVAYYGPRADFALSARFTKPPAEVSVTTVLLLTLSDKGQEVRGGLSVRPEVEKLFSLDFTVPPKWHVRGVTTAEGKPLRFERYGAGDDKPEDDKPGEDKPGRIHVHLPQGIPPGKEFRILFHAERMPGGAPVSDKPVEVAFPVFAVTGTVRDVGAIAVVARDDMIVRPRPDLLKQLVPLDEDDKKQFHLEDVTTGLAYRYESRPYEASFILERTRPRLTARTFSFLRVDSGVLAAHYEIIHDVQEARMRTLVLSLPKDTPADVSIRGLDGVKLKQYTGKVADGRRRWTVQLAEARRDTIRLAVDFQQPLDAEQPKDFVLPVARAEGVEYQSGVVVVEGSAELDVEVKTHPRQVDVGELVDAEYQPGRRLLGVYGFVGDPADEANRVRIDVARHPGYRLYPAVVQRARLTTRLSAEGTSQTEVRFELRTAAQYLEVKLPPGSELWSAALDGKPIKPQREGGSVLVSLPATAAAARSLQLVYETPVSAVGMMGNIEVFAPKLLLRASQNTAAVEVPLAELEWDLHAPPGYEVVRSGGTVVTDDVKRPKPAIVQVVKALYWPAGGLFAPASLGCSHEGREKSAPTKSVAKSKERPFPGTGGVGGRFEDTEPVMYPDADAWNKMTAKRHQVPGRVVEEAEKEPARPQAPPMQAPPAEAQPSPTVSMGVKGVFSADLDIPFDKPAKKAAKLTKGLEGFRSLKIDLADQGRLRRPAITFHSLGVGPRLEVTLVHSRRLDALGWAVGMAVALVGLALTGRTARAKIRFILAVAAIATVVPLLPGLLPMAGPANMAFYAACVLAPYYIVAGLVMCLARWVLGLISGRARRIQTATAAGAAILAAFVLTATTAAAGPPAKRAEPYVIQVVPPPAPVNVPDDAVIVPYNSDSWAPARDARQWLVPYDKYVELWNRAYPDKKLEVGKPPAPYSLAGVAYTTRLEGDEYLLVEGRMEIDVFTDGHVTIPLGLDGGVLARAELDGKPARLSVARAGTPQPGAAGLRLHVSGRGRHRLDLGVRLKLQRRGGWRVADGVLPSAAAGSLAITVPDTETEVRLDHVADRKTYETETAERKIETALAPGGAVRIQWRPKPAEGEVDRSLTVRSDAVLDVQEDALRVAWRLDLQFRRDRRDTFTVNVPKEYLVERVEGTNVRGWEVAREETHQSVKVSLLETARRGERFTVHLWRRGPVGEGPLGEFSVPIVTAPEAALQSGRITIRRSPLLDLRTVSTDGVSRTDLTEFGGCRRRLPSPTEAPSIVNRRQESPPTTSRRQESPPTTNRRQESPPTVVDKSASESPLGIRPYAAYQFATVPFAIRLAAVPVAVKATAEVQTVLKISPHERNLESRVKLSVGGRPIHRVAMLLPKDLTLENVLAPGEFQWAVTAREGNAREGRPMLSIYLAEGRQGDLSVIVRGKLARAEDDMTLPLPRLEVLDVERQQGDIAVQVDPAWKVKPSRLDRCETVLPSRLYGWLEASQRRATQLALHYRGPDYDGTLAFSPRAPDVACQTITNVRVTDRAVEETILLDFTIREAGIRELSFLLPERMQGCRVSVPMLRQKTIRPAGGDEPGWIRVTLALQDEVMGQLRVLVENDRLLTGEVHAAPIPIVETDGAARRFVALESAGRDEIVVDEKTLAALEPLGRQQKDWATLKGILGTGITRAYVVRRGAERPNLAFTTKARAAVQTVGARIDLAETDLLLDAAGGYRAKLVYTIDNTTEQTLQVALPHGARLWSVWVAGRPVKPIKDPDAVDGRHICIPLVKTAPGELPYEVVLLYGGELAPLGRLRASVDFPLIRTVKINVQRSQVRLHLPSRYRWFDFDGTMSAVADEGGLEAGRRASITEVGQRLIDTMRCPDSSYARIRAARSFENLKSQMEDLESSAGEYYGNKQLQKERAANVEMFRQAEQEAQRLEAEVKQADVQEDNRRRLNSLYEQQKAVRSGKVVSDLGANWKDLSRKPDQGKDRAGFNREWLNQNALNNPELARSADEPLMGTQKPRDTGQPRDAVQQRVQFGYPGAKTPSGSRVQPKAATLADDPFESKTERSKLGLDAQQRQRAKRNGRADKLGRYQEQLRQQAMPQRPRSKKIAPRREEGMGIIGGTGSIGDGMRPGFDMDEQKELELDEKRLEGKDETTTRSLAVDRVTPETALPAGLVGMAITLPEPDPRYYRTYRFAKIRGDARITARAASDRILTTFGHFAAVIVAVLLAVWIIRSGFGWLSAPSVSTLLIVLGVVATCTLIFPIAGLLAVVAGIAIKFRRAVAKA